MEELFIIDKNDLYLRIIQDEFQLAHRNGWIDRGKYDARLLYGQVNHYPFGAVFSDDPYLIHSFRGPVSAGYPQFQEAQAQFINNLLYFRCTILLPFSIFLGRKHIRVRSFFQVELDAIEQSFAFGHISSLKGWGSPHPASNYRKNK